jgi:hypothetical protein
MIVLVFPAGAPKRENKIYMEGHCEREACFQQQKAKKKHTSGTINLLL